MSARETYSDQLLREIAEAIRTAAAMGARIPGWATHLLVSWDPLHGESEEGLRVGFLPCRATVPDELVVVDFDIDERLPLPDGFVALLSRSLCPFIIGVGEVRADLTAKGLVLFRTEDGEGKNLLGHDASSVEITPEMVEAGIREYALFEFIDPAEWVVSAVYRAMAAATADPIGAAPKSPQHL